MTGRILLLIPKSAVFEVNGNKQKMHVIVDVSSVYL